MASFFFFDLADVGGIGGVNFVLRCIFDRVTGKGGHSWQWILGRLNVLEKLMEEYPQEFYLVLVPTHQKRSGSVDFSGSPIASRQERLLTLLHFALDALHVSHATVVKQAREVFFKAAHFAATVPSVIHQVYSLALTNPLLKARLGTWMRDQLGGGNLGRRRPSIDDRLGASIARRRPSTDGQLGCSASCCSGFQRSFQTMTKGHPHLPSCGGVSPTKGLDRSYLMEKMTTIGLGDTRQSSPWRPNHNSCNDSGVFSPSSQWTQLFGHEHSDGHAKNLKKFSTRNRRPTFLPLDGTFRDVLEWERVAGKASSPSSRPSRYRSPTRFDKKTSPTRKPWESSLKSYPMPPSPLSMASCPSSGLENGLHPRTQPTIKKQSLGSPSCNCTCSREMALPLMRKTPDQPQRNNRLCYKKLNGLIGPILPSLISPGRLQKDPLSLEPPVVPATNADSDYDQIPGW